MPWYARDFDLPQYFDVYRNKEIEALEEGPALAAMLDLPSGAAVLDLPCGWGRLAPALRARGYAVVGGDLSPRNLRRHAEEQPGPIVRLDFRRLPFRAGCADGVLCAYTSWGYFASDQENLAQLTEFARVLKPGGVLLLDLVGRSFLERAVGLAPSTWYEVEDAETTYLERVRWSPDRRRVWTERRCNGARLRHDIWIPTDGEVRACLAQAGLALDRRWGGLGGEDWEAQSERWIYRSLKPGAP